MPGPSFLPSINMLCPSRFLLFFLFVPEIFKVRDPRLWVSSFKTVKEDLGIWIRIWKEDLEDLEHLGGSKSSSC